MTGARLHEVSAPGDNSCLRTAQELVAREGDEGGTRLERLAHGGLARQPRRRATHQPGSGRVEQAGAEVDDDRGPERCELDDVHCRREADDAVVRLVHLHDERNVI